MTSKWRIVAPLDLRRGSGRAVENAVTFAAKLSADLDLLHVMDRDYTRTAQERPWPPEACDEHQGDVRVRRAMRVGPPAAAVATYADDVDADLIFLTSHVTRWSKLWRRSTTEQIFHRSRRPVCAAAARHRQVTLASRRVLCLLDLQRTDSALLAHARRLVERIDGELLLLYVLPDTIERLDEISIDMDLPGNLAIVAGDPADCFVTAARDHSVGLVMATRAPAAPRRTHGAGFHEILPRLHCPLLTVPASNSGVSRSAAGSKHRNAEHRRETPLPGVAETEATAQQLFG
jgi:nucleotide-binding universal stress UspA family protein